ncbi:MAG: hypothetical protein IK143_06390 [Bacteroidales bacterium]|nr:hypothetical protein [Bacteroidales bacterium]
MKRIEDIEKMDLDALERAALEENISVPEGLSERIENAIIAEEVLNVPDRRKKVLRILFPVAAAAVVAAAIVIPSRNSVTPLQDTFDDPYLAYAEVEKAFQKISGQMSAGVEATELAAATAGKPINIINNINEK